MYVGNRLGAAPVRDRHEKTLAFCSQSPTIQHVGVQHCGPRGRRSAIGSFLNWAAKPSVRKFPEPLQSFPFAHLHDAFPDFTCLTSCYVHSNRKVPRFIFSVLSIRRSSTLLVTDRNLNLQLGTEAGRDNNTARQKCFLLNVVWKKLEVRQQAEAYLNSIYSSAMDERSVQVPTCTSDNSGGISLFACNGPAIAPAMSCLHRAMLPSSSPVHWG